MKDRRRSIPNLPAPSNFQLEPIDNLILKQLQYQGTNSKIQIPQGTGISNNQFDAEAGKNNKLLSTFYK